MLQLVFSRGDVLTAIITRTFKNIVQADMRRLMTDKKISDTVTGVVRYAGSQSGIPS